MARSIIIIGAGLAGLAAGCYAQMNGYKTQIFEMHNIPGGLCTRWWAPALAFTTVSMRNWEQCRAGAWSTTRSLCASRGPAGEPHSLTLELEEPLKVGDQMRRWLPIRHFCYDPSMAPPGKSVVMVSFLFANYAYWKKLYEDSERYKAEKQAPADAVIGRLEKRFPGIKEQIEVVDVATLVTYERYTGNWQGSYMGWKADPTDMSNWMSRTLPGLRSFYMAGHWVFSGSGVSGAITSGRHVMQVICKKDKRRFTTTVP